MKTLVGAVVIIACFAAPPAGAAGSSEPPSSPARASDPVYDKAVAATQSQDWTGAQKLLQQALESNPNNANYHNLYAYAIRKGPNPNLDLAFKHYNEALRIDPNHRAAHEYLGEAYLMVGNLPKAKEQLAALDKLCFLPCEEFRELKKAVADYEERRAKP